MALRLAVQVSKFLMLNKKNSLFSIQKYLKKYVAVFKNINFWKNG